MESSVGSQRPFHSRFGSLLGRGLWTILLPVFSLGYTAFADPLPSSSVSTQPVSIEWIQQVQEILTALTGQEALSERELLEITSTAEQLIDPRTGSEYQTSEGNPLPFFRFEPTNPECSELPEQVRTVLFIGGIHGDEIGPAYASFRHLAGLLIHPEQRPERTRVIYAPLTNPDGLFAAESQVTGPNGNPRRPEQFCYRRSSGEPAWHSSAGRRNLSNGRDPNRSFGRDLERGVAGTGERMRTRRTRAGSPTEARYIAHLIQEFRPEVVISLHGPFGTIDYDGPASPDRPQDETDHALSRWLGDAASAGRLREDHGYAPLPNSLGSYGLRRGIHVITIEFPNKCGVYAQPDLEEHQEAISSLLEVPADLPRRIPSP